MKLKFEVIIRDRKTGAYLGYVATKKNISGRAASKIAQEKNAKAKPHEFYALRVSKADS